MGTSPPDKTETGAAKYSLKKYAGLFVVFAFPWVGLVTIGLPLIFSSWVGVLYGAILIFFVTAIIATAAAILYFVYGYGKHGNKGKVTPVGKMKPSWIITLNIVGMSVIGDIVISVLLVCFAVTKSSYTPTISLELLGIIVPVVLVGAVAYREGVLALLGRDFRMPLGEDDTILWVNSSLAKVLLSERLRRGIAYLRNSLAIIRQIFVEGGRSSESLNDGISLTNFAFKTKIQVNYERLLQLARRVFPADSVPRLDIVSDQCRYLKDDLDFDWFKQTKEISGSEKTRVIRANKTLLEIVQSVLQYTGFGTIFGAVAKLVVLASSSKIGLGFNGATTLAIVVIIIAAVFSYWPARWTLQVLSVFVWPGDLIDYSRGYDRLPE